MLLILPFLTNLLIACRETPRNLAAWACVIQSSDKFIFWLTLSTHFIKIAFVNLPQISKTPSRWQE